jgi:hypothetical protein
MLARASTVAQSGFGTGAITTVVSLNWTQSSQRPREILVLSGEFEKPLDEVSVEMNWLTATHLELTYKGHRTIAFQAVKWNGVEISVRGPSGGVR